MVVIKSPHPLGSQHHEGAARYEVGTYFNASGWSKGQLLSRETSQQSRGWTKYKRTSNVLPSLIQLHKNFTPRRSIPLQALLRHYMQPGLETGAKHPVPPVPRRLGEPLGLVASWYVLFQSPLLSFTKGSTLGIPRH